MGGIGPLLVGGGALLLLVLTALVGVLAALGSAVGSVFSNIVSNCVNSGGAG